jgi:hypothetical protein
MSKRDNADLADLAYWVEARKPHSCQCGHVVPAGHTVVWCPVHGWNDES